MTVCLECSVTFGVRCLPSDKSLFLGNGDSSVIERAWVRVPAGAAGEFSSFPGSTFCADSYFGIRVTAVARKKSRSFCQKCRWQVTVKHSRTLRLLLCGTN